LFKKKSTNNLPIWYWPSDADNPLYQCHSPRGWQTFWGTVWKDIRHDAYVPEEYPSKTKQLQQASERDKG